MTPSPAELIAALPDAVVLSGSGVEGHGVSGLLPRAVVQVQTPEQAAGALRLANDHGWAVAPRGGGTLLDLGNPIERLDMVLDLTRLDAVLDYQPDDLTLTVQAGITKAAIDRLLAERGQMLALDVPLPEAATIGGALAASVSGPRRLRYGTARDLVIGMQAALADGTLARSGGKVVKNVAGYDLAKLHIGGLGTCGVITEATFKLWPAPPAQGALLAQFETLAAAHAAALRLLDGRLFPAALEIAGPGASHRLLAKLGSERSSGGWTLCVLLLGTIEAVERMAREIVSDCTAAGSRAVVRLDEDERQAVFADLRDFGREGGDPVALIMRAGVLPSDLPVAVQALSAAGTVLHAEPSIIARPGAGLATGYWPEVAVSDVPAAVQAARSSLHSRGGSLTVERSPLAVAHQIDAWGLDGSDIPLMRRLKDAYDPNRVLNPGRFAAGI